MSRALPIGLLPLLILLAAPALAAEDDDNACPTGKVRNEDTLGQCCWEGQAWSSLYGTCVGLAECPAGLLPTDDGEDCSPAECVDGQVEMGDGCCWPGQTYAPPEPGEGAVGRCLGAPVCPAGRAPSGADCVELPALPEPVDAPYVPIAPGDAERIEPGPFTRGSPRRERGRFRNERAHGVVLTRPFLMKKTEVTRAEWLRVVGRDPGRFSGCGPDCPVERVSWYEALHWLNALSEREGLPACYTLEQCTGEPGGGCRLDQSQIACAGEYRCDVVRFSGLECPGYRLPTEAEWEYAARADTESATPIGELSLPQSNFDPILEPIAVYAGNSGVDYPGAVDCASWPERKTFARACGPQPVGQRAPNAWRLDDMLGNVAEWVWDGYGRYPRQSQVDPVQHLGLERVVRGGSWADGARSMRVALRGRMPPTGRNATVGFRWARTIRSDVPPEALRAPAAVEIPVGPSPVEGPPPGDVEREPLSAPDLVLGPIRVAADPPLTIPIIAEDEPPAEDAPEPADEPHLAGSPVPGGALGPRSSEDPADRAAPSAAPEPAPPPAATTPAPTTPAPTTPAGTTPRRPPPPGAPVSRTPAPVSRTPASPQARPSGASPRERTRGDADPRDRRRRLTVRPPSPDAPDASPRGVRLQIAPLESAPDDE